jgi:hypothetical protein
VRRPHSAVMPARGGDHAEGRTVAVVAHRVLEIPEIEAEAGGVGGAASAEPEVLVRPVPVSTPDIEQHVVGVVIDVEVDGEGGVGAAVGAEPLQGEDVGGGPGGGEGGEVGVPSGEIAGLDFAGIDGVPVGGFAAEIAGGEVLVGAFAEIVEAPVESVEVDVDEAAVGGGLAHGEGEAAPELVAEELFGVAGGVPGVAVVGAGAGARGCRTRGRRRTVRRDRGAAGRVRIRP